MGTSKTPAEFAGKLRKAGESVRSGSPQALRKAADAASDVFARSPGFPRGGVAHKRAGMSVKMMGNTAAVRPKGPVHLVNNPTKPHVIVRRAFVGTRGRGKKAQRGAALLAAFGVDATNYGGPLGIPGVGPRASAHHPGTHGKHFWEHAEPEAATAAKRAAMAETVKNMARSLGSTVR